MRTSLILNMIIIVVVCSMNGLDVKGYKSQTNQNKIKITKEIK